MFRLCFFDLFAVNLHRELQRIENATHSPIISHLTETIEGVTTIRAYNQESRFMEMLFKRLEANTITFTIMTTSNRWLGISLVSQCMRKSSQIIVKDDRI